MNVALTECLRVAEEAARAGGQILLQYRYQPLDIEHKDHQEVVTNVDKLADQAICAVLSRYFPAYTLLSEESGTINGTSPYTWIIDPLDGTESYIRGQNFSAVTIALSKEGQTLVGVVFHPFQDELYTAILGGETTVNGYPARVTDITAVEQARLILDYSPRDELRRHFFAIEWERGMKQMFRIGGSVALNMCLIAKGAAEGYVYGRIRNRLKSWDLAAATLVVQGAGGRVLDRQGCALDPNQLQGFVLCCNHSLELASLFQGHVLSPQTA